MKEIKFNNYDFSGPFFSINPFFNNMNSKDNIYSYNNNFKQLFSNPIVQNAVLLNNNNIKEYVIDNSLEQSLNMNNIMIKKKNLFSKRLSRNRNEKINYMSKSTQTIHNSINNYFRRINEYAACFNSKKKNIEYKKKIHFFKNNHSQILNKKPKNSYINFINKSQLSLKKNNIINSCLKIFGKYNFSQSQMDRIKYLLILNDKKNNLKQIVKIRKKLFEKNEELKEKDKSLIIKSYEHKKESFNKRNLGSSQIISNKYISKKNNSVLPNFFNKH